jgi:hypothetical protein
MGPLAVLFLCFARMPCVLRHRVVSGRSAAWLARLVRDQEVEGSNPFAPTILFNYFHATSGFSSTAL